MDAPPLWDGHGNWYLGTVEGQRTGAPQTHVVKTVGVKDGQVTQDNWDRIGVW